MKIVILHRYAQIENTEYVETFWQSYVIKSAP